MSLDPRQVDEANGGTFPAAAASEIRLPEAFLMDRRRPTQHGTDRPAAGAAGGLVDGGLTAPLLGACWAPPFAGHLLRPSWWFPRTSTCDRHSMLTTIETRHGMSIRVVTAHVQFLGQ